MDLFYHPENVAALICTRSEPQNGLHLEGFALVFGSPNDFSDQSDCFFFALLLLSRYVFLPFRSISCLSFFFVTFSPPTFSPSFLSPVSMIQVAFLNSLFR